MAHNRAELALIMGMANSQLEYDKASQLMKLGTAFAFAGMAAILFGVFVLGLLAYAGCLVAGYFSVKAGDRAQAIAVATLRDAGVDMTAAPDS